MLVTWLVVLKHVAVKFDTPRNSLRVPPCSPWFYSLTTESTEGRGGNFSERLWDGVDSCRFSAETKKL